jgi:hypothetical protein
LAHSRSAPNSSNTDGRTGRVASHNRRLSNHISGHKGGVAGIYNRATYLPEKKNALDMWAHHLKTIVAQKTGANVTALKKKRH